MKYIKYELETNFIFLITLSLLGMITNNPIFSVLILFFQIISLNLNLKDRILFLALALPNAYKIVVKILLTTLFFALSKPYYLDFANNNIFSLIFTSLILVSLVTLSTLFANIYFNKNKTIIILLTFTIIFFIIGLVSFILIDIIYSIMPIFLMILSLILVIINIKVFNYLIEKGKYD